VSYWALLKERKYKMKRFVLVGVIMAMFVPGAALCLGADETAEYENVERQLDLRQRELELQGREAELGFHGEMRKLKLEQRRMELQHKRAGKKHAEGWKHKREDKAAPFLIVITIVHILMAVWVYQDIRKRGAGSGIWIVVALLTGLLGTLVYAVVRLGDTHQAPK
jgi:hypothetical protein